MLDPAKILRGRGAAENPPNRFESVHCTEDLEHLELADDRAESSSPRTEFLVDNSQSIVTENDSPDIPFRFGINPYRGCEHGCAYCYARPYHEYLGMGAGLDFESKILVKHDAPQLLRATLAKPSWQPEVIVISGVTDCYQPAERRFRLTRGLLEVLLEARHPLGIITKNALVLRDLDLLGPLAERNLVHVFISVTTLDAELARTMEPRTSSPSAKLAAIRALSAAGVPVGVMVAPVIPGLTDHEIPAVLQAAAEAGAHTAGYTLLRLPLSVRPVFQTWLAAHYPSKRDRVEGLLRSTRGGALNDANFGSRMRGAGEYAEQIVRTFKVFKRRYGLTGPMPALDTSQFRPPRAPSGQLSMF